jgi:hypothetical protein
MVAIVSTIMRSTASSKTAEGISFHRSLLSKAFKSSGPNAAAHSGNNGTRSSRRYASATTMPIVEMERPNERLFNLDGRPANRLAGALTQISDWFHREGTPCGPEGTFEVRQERSITLERKFDQSYGQRRLASLPPEGMDKLVLPHRYREKVVSLRS